MSDREWCYVEVRRDIAILVVSRSSRHHVLRNKWLMLEPRNG